MLRLLHLRPLLLDFQGQRCLDDLRGLGPDFTPITRIVPSGGLTGLARGVIAVRQHLRTDQPDVIHAWNEETLAAAVLAGGQRIIFSPTLGPTANRLAWINRLLQREQRKARPATIEIVASSPSIRQQLLRIGQPTGQVHVIRPGIDVSRLRKHGEGNLRAALGLDQRDLVLFSPGESTRGAGHRRAVWTLALLYELNPRRRIVLWGRSPAADSARRLAHRLEHDEMLVLAEPRLRRPVEPEELATIADAVLVCPDGPIAPLSVALCMAAGLPIVATIDEQFADVIQDRVTALTVASTAASKLARSLLELEDKPSLVHELGQSAARKAEEMFSLARFLDEWREVYGGMAGGD